MADGLELLSGIFDLEAAQQAAQLEAEALEASALALRSGWTDRRWRLMEEAAASLQQQWDEGSIGIEEALAVSDEIVKRESGTSYTCGAVATAAVITAMQPGEPIVAGNSHQPTGIVVTAPRLEFSAHKKRPSIPNPTVLDTSVSFLARRFHEASGAISDTSSESSPYVRSMAEVFTVGQAAIQTLVDGSKYSINYDSNDCGTRSYRFSNTGSLISLLKTVEAFTAEGIPFDTKALKIQIATGQESDASYARVRAAARNRRRRPRLLR